MRVSLLIFGLMLSLTAQAKPLDPLIAEGRVRIALFQQQLMATVKAAMESGGSQQAVQACNLLAPKIADEHAGDSWQLGRTALRVRNAGNAPDAWERAVLERFVQRAAAGEPLEAMQHAERIGGELRLMKAIPTAETCLGCHGSSIDPDLAALIDRYYPQDQAREFTLGELRGAFSLRRRLP